ncbi:MAG: hypothetical protein H6557_13880 [Lewinellaceae bacterium]|nr:hypothetical protein [Phaeodactylibacter sp.]MCB9037699.1 hypothetical protein [Lewinellaceae bacterium]
MQERSTSRLSEWLDNLARESWQLELIISGFAIFLLIGIYEPLDKMGTELMRGGLSERMQVIVGLPLGSLTAAWFILLVNLCIHVLFRGLWISTIGLRSVSDDIDFEALRFTPRFDRFLQRKVGSFDRYVERLEKICSVLFAFTFLILFMLLALGGVAALLGLGNLLLWEWLGPGDHALISIFNILILVGSLMYFIDFVTLGYFKRIRWLAVVYYPIYRFFSFVTLARLYRPIYYNLIDNRFGRGVGFLLVPYIVLLIVGSSITFNADAYFPKSPPASTFLNSIYYDDLRAEDIYSEAPGIASRFVGNGFLELFIPYQPKEDDKALKAVCPGLEAARSTGLSMEGAITIQEGRSSINIDSILLCMGHIHRIFVDDRLLAEPGFRFYTHPQRRDNGLLAMLDVQYLARGEHLLRVETQRLQQDSLVWEEKEYIPFWKE